MTYTNDFHDYDITDVAYLLASLGSSDVLVFSGLNARPVLQTILMGNRNGKRAPIGRFMAFPNGASALQWPAEFVVPRTKKKKRIVCRTRIGGYSILVNDVTVCNSTNATSPLPRFPKCDAHGVIAWEDYQNFLSIVPLSEDDEWEFKGKGWFDRSGEESSLTDRTAAIYSGNLDDGYAYTRLITKISPAGATMPTFVLRAPTLRKAFDKLQPFFPLDVGLDGNFHIMWQTFGYKFVGSFSVMRR